MVDHNVLRWLKSHDTPHFDHFPHVKAYNIRTTETPSLETTAIKSTFLTTANNVIAILTAFHIIAVAGVACTVVVSANNSLRKGPGQPHARTSATLCTQEQVHCTQEQLTPCTTHSPSVPLTHPLCHPLTPCTTHSPPVPPTHLLCHPLTPCTTHSPSVPPTHPLCYTPTPLSQSPPVLQTHPRACARLSWPTIVTAIICRPVLSPVSHSPQCCCGSRCIGTSHSCKYPQLVQNTASHYHPHCTRQDRTEQQGPC